MIFYKLLLFFSVLRLKKPISKCLCYKQIKKKCQLALLQHVMLCMDILQYVLLVISTHIDCGLFDFGKDQSQIDFDIDNKL